MKYGSEYAVTSPVTGIYKLKRGAISCLSPWQEINYWECLYEPWVLQGVGDIANWHGPFGGNRVGDVTFLNKHVLWPSNSTVETQLMEILLHVYKYLYVQGYLREGLKWLCIQKRNKLQCGHIGTPCFYCASLYCPSQILWFYKSKVCGNPASSKSISTVFPMAFAHFASLCHVISRYFKFFLLFYALWWSLIFDVITTTCGRLAW